MVGEYAVQWFGYPVGFLTLAVIAGGALLFFLLPMPETRPDAVRKAKRSRLEATRLMGKLAALPWATWGIAADGLDIALTQSWIRPS